MALVSCCLSAAGLRFLRHPVPPGDWTPLTIGLPRRLRQHGPERGFRVPHAWATAGSGAFSTPGAAVPARPGVPLPAAACRFSTARPCHPGLQPAPGCPIHEASAKVHCRSPQPAFPSPVVPGGTGPSGFSLSFAPGRTRPCHARQGGDGLLGTARITSLA